MSSSRSVTQAKLQKPYIWRRIQLSRPTPQTHSHCPEASQDQSSQDQSPAFKPRITSETTNTGAGTPIPPFWRPASNYKRLNLIESNAKPHEALGFLWRRLQTICSHIGFIKGDVKNLVEKRKREEEIVVKLEDGNQIRIQKQILVPGQIYRRVGQIRPRFNKAQDAPASMADPSTSAAPDPLHDPNHRVEADPGVSAEPPPSAEPRVDEADPSRPTESLIRRKITDALAPSVLRIHNDSHLHAHHAAMRDWSAAAAPVPETHFRLVIVSEAFKGKGQPARHRMVYKLLDEEMNREGGVHALQLSTRTAEEEEGRRKRAEE